jgi:hypothetical protein
VSATCAFSRMCRDTIHYILLVFTLQASQLESEVAGVSLSSVQKLSLQATTVIEAVCTFVFPLAALIPQVSMFIGSLTRWK